MSQERYILKETGDNARLNLQHRLFRGPFLKAVHFLDESMSLKGRILLDFGCGNSSIAPDLKGFLGGSGQYWGVDTSEDQIELARREYPQHQYWVGNENTKEIQEALGKVDVVFMRFVVMHQPTPQVFIKKIYECLKPGAMLLMQEVEESDACCAAVHDAYPGAEQLFKLKARFGESLGLDYNIAGKLSGFLETLEVAHCEHHQEVLEIDFPDAKHFLREGFANMREKALVQQAMSHSEDAYYSGLIEALPERSETPFCMGVMHTFLLQKPIQEGSI